MTDHADQSIILATPPPTHTARWEDTGQPLYEHRPNGNLIGELTLGSYPDFRDPRSTLARKDGGDPWEYAPFISASGRRILITRDKGSAGVPPAGSDVPSEPSGVARCRTELTSEEIGQLMGGN